MNSGLLQGMREWFEKYVNSFYSGDENLQSNTKLKYEHTINVWHNMKKLGESLNLNEHDIVLAETIGLLHDVGRFEQYAKYRTFRDSISEDHAALGISIINRYNVLAPFNEDDREIIITAIENHNKFKIEKHSTKDVNAVFSKMIRDADKLDVLNLVAGFCRDDKFHSNPAFENMPDEKDYSNDFIENILNYKLCSIRNVKTVNDLKMMYTGWVYDIYFSDTLKRIKKNDYIGIIFRSIPQSEAIDRLYSHLMAYVDMRID